MNFWMRGTSGVHANAKHAKKLLKNVDLLSVGRRSAFFDLLTFAEMLSTPTMDNLQFCVNSFQADVTGGEGQAHFVKKAKRMLLRFLLLICVHQICALAQCE